MWISSTGVMGVVSRRVRMPLTVRIQIAVLQLGQVVGWPRSVGRVGLNFVMGEYLGEYWVGVLVGVLGVTSGE